MVSFFCVLSYTDSPIAKDIHVHPINPDSNSLATYDLAKSWIHGCLTTHRHDAVHDAAPMPARLLQVDDLSPKGDVRITDRVYHNQQEVSFVALSYCWGGDQPHKLTAENLKSCEGILQYAQLPRTIQDAINVTKGLDCGYLWVYSLCILQDDEEEKHREIRKMPFIFARAVVTIAAANASTAFDGFFHPRSQEEEMISLSIQDHNGQRASIIARNSRYIDELGHSRNAFSRLAFLNIPGSNLASRVLLLTSDLATWTEEMISITIQTISFITMFYLPNSKTFQRSMSGGSGL